MANPGENLKDLMSGEPLAEWPKEFRLHATTCFARHGLLRRDDAQAKTKPATATIAVCILAETVSSAGRKRLATKAAPRN
jgi:hypothetical protein